MKRWRYARESLARFFLSLALAGCGLIGDEGNRAAADHDSDSSKADVVVKQQGPETEANPTTPTVAVIKLYFKLDPRLTRGRQVGDQWVSPPTFTTTRYRGRQLSLDVRAAGVDHRGRLLYRHLDVEWLPADPPMVVVSPEKGSEVTITMQSPGESTLRVTRGELSQTLTLRTTYDEQNDLTQLVISRGRQE